MTFWTKLSQDVENRYAACVKDRVRLYMTRYRKAHDEALAASLHIDGAKVLDFSYMIYCRETWYAAQSGVIFELRPKCAADRDVFQVDDVWSAFMHLRDDSIDAALTSQCPLKRALSILDARVGKRRLTKINVIDETQLVQRLWYLRCSSEGITIPNNIKVNLRPLTEKIRTDYYSNLYKAMSKQEIENHMIV